MDHSDRQHQDAPGLDDEVPAAFDLRELLRLHPRLLGAAALVAVLMFPVGLVLAAIGIAVLELSGGAARDTSIVVAIAAYVVADFWGGGAVAALTRARAPQVAVAWGVARFGVLVLVVLAAPRLAAVLPVQLLLAVPAAWAGARVARKQAALRRQIRAEQAAAGAGDDARQSPNAAARALR